MSSEHSPKITFSKFITDFITYRASHGKDSTPDENSHEVVFNFKELDLFRWIKHMDEEHMALEKGLKSNMLTQQQVKILKAVDFPFTRRFSTRWDESYNSLVEFQAQHGHVRVPIEVETLQLYRWLTKQRASFIRFEDGKTSAMTEERIERLELIDGFSWSVYSDMWSSKYLELKEFASNHGHCQVPNKCAENKPLGAWVALQRKRYKAKHSGAPSPRKVSDITDEQIETLEDIGFQWTLRK